MVDAEVERLAAPEPHAGANAEPPQQKASAGQVVVVVLVVLAACGVCNACGDDTPSSSSTSSASSTASAVASAPDPAADSLAASERVAEMIETVRAFDSSDLRGSKTGIAAVVASLKLFAGAALDAERDDTPRAGELRAAVEQLQRREFPRLRDAMGPAFRQDFWQEDMEVRTFGRGFRTIRFTGAAFAANRNIGEFQTGVQETLHLLRFRRAEYEWYRDASNMQFYAMENIPDDGDLIR